MSDDYRRIELITGTARRRHSTTEQKLQIIEESLQGSFCRELGTILFVEQNLDTILAISDRCYVMEKGRISAGIAPGQVTPDEVRRHLML